MASTFGKNEREHDASTIDVAILVRNELLRSGLEAILLRISRVGSVGLKEPFNLPEIISSGQFQVLVVDIDQWEMLGNYFDLFGRNSPRVLVIGDDLDKIDGSRFSALPCDGFLSVGGLCTDSLGRILDRTLLGEMPMPAALVRRLLLGTSRPGMSPVPRTVALTPREGETLTHLAAGMSNKQIARSLGISTHGAKRLVGAVLLKLGSPNRTAAVVTAIKSGLV